MLAFSHGIIWAKAHFACALAHLMLVRAQKKQILFTGKEECPLHLDNRIRRMPC